MNATFYLSIDVYSFISENLPLILLAEGEDFKSGAIALVIILGAVGFGFVLGRVKFPDRDPNKNQIEKLLKEIKELVIKNNQPPAV